MRTRALRLMMAFYHPFAALQTGLGAYAQRPGRMPEAHGIAFNATRCEIH